MKNLQDENIDPHAVMSVYKIHCNYRGCELEFSVRSAFDDYLTRQACLLHGIGVDKGMVHALACEDQLLDGAEGPDEDRGGR